MLPWRHDTVSLHCRPVRSADPSPAINSGKNLHYTLSTSRKAPFGQFRPSQLEAGVCCEAVSSPLPLDDSFPQICLAMRIGADRCCSDCAVHLLWFIAKTTPSDWGMTRAPPWLVAST